jgi:hypothetical protein
LGPGTGTGTWAKWHGSGTLVIKFVRVNKKNSDRPLICTDITFLKKKSLS